MRVLYKMAVGLPKHQSVRLLIPPNWLRLGSLRKITNILGVESSCDDTGAAVVDCRGKIWGESLCSQTGYSVRFGGVIPIVAKYLHMKHIERVVNAALGGKEVDAVACTVEPGMVMSLRVGAEYSAKLARELNIPYIPIHHMEAHALTVRMVHDLKFPFLVLLASGGHCQLALANDVDEYSLLGNCLDIAPGDLFDKVARRLRLSTIPEFSETSGGKAIDVLSSRTSHTDKFNAPDVDTTTELTIPMIRYRSCDFSFGGIQAATIALIEREQAKYGQRGVLPSAAHIARACQTTAVRHILHRVARAMDFCTTTGLLPRHARTLVVSGGCACNNHLKSALGALCTARGWSLLVPPPQLCTDNGIMIAWNGIEKWRKYGKAAAVDLENIRINPKSPLGRDIRAEVERANIKVQLKSLPIL